MTTRVPVETFPPGEFLKDELDARGWTQEDLAKILGRPARLVNEIIAGKKTITPETARGLGAALGTDPQLWMRLDDAYQLARSEHDDETVTRMARLYELAPMKELIRRHWIEASENIGVLEARVARFLGLESLEAAATTVAALRSTAQPCAEQRAWLARARQMAAIVHAKPFNSKGLPELFGRLQELMANAEDARLVPRVLADYGVRFVVVEQLPHSRIDGACFWLDDKTPAVALSVRYDRIDAFWFTLMHELGHVQRGDGKQGELGPDLDLVGDHAQKPEEKSASERAADQFASEALVREADISSFAMRVRPLYSKLEISGFAKRTGVHPGIVVGRLQHMGEIPYGHSREMLSKIRSHVVQDALTDGWGNRVPLEAEI